MRPIILCGCSGVGKGTIIKSLMSKYPDKFGFSVSHTTRAPRDGEINGVHYHFTTKDQMLRDIEAGQFIEHAHVHSNLYGTSFQAVKDVLSSNRVCILDIDIQGAQQVKASKILNPVIVFIKAPSFEELEKRLRGRATETEDSIMVRLNNARQETAFAERNENNFFDDFVVNDQLDSAVKQLTIIMNKHVEGLNIEV